jgi:hypothetical protein
MPVRARHLLLVAALLAGLAVSVPTASAKPQVCIPAAIQQSLVAAGKLSASDIKHHEVVDLVRCGDVTGDGVTDAVFTVASGGTAGDTRFGVIHGSDGALLLYKSAYKVGIARHDSRSFDILQPHYGPNDPNCCPKSFREQRFTWNGARFRGGPLKKLATAPRRFYRP